jgi:hypothetical protein
VYALLFALIESLFIVQASGQLVGDATIGEGTVRLWMMAALLNEGFQPEATVEIS